MLRTSLLAAILIFRLRNVEFAKREGVHLLIIFPPSVDVQGQTFIPIFY